MVDGLARAASFRSIIAMAVTKAMMGLKVIVTKIQKILLKDRVDFIIPVKLNC